VELHQTDYKKAGLEDLGKPNGYVERQVSNWSKQYLKAATQEIPEAHKVMDWLSENQPKEYKHALIHNDFKYDNVVFKDNSWKEVNAVLDWEMCTLGDPLMDLGTSLAYWSMDSDSDFITKGWPSPTAIKGNPGREELVQMYAQKSGQNIDNIVFYYAFGLFKVAVIVQQIYYRYSKGLTTDKKFAHLDKAAQLFCVIAWQAIQKNRIEKLF
ncbi:MAG: phosphotransferase family protein, partial [Saprospiraceae bacterium]